MADDARRAPTVFLSYASENREVARRIGASLPAFGLEVWYDESELGGGDAWDQKIRRQIRECDFFMALVSAQTEARREGYFRREWRLAAERTLDIADDHLFLLPIVIDDTDAATARVPEKFQSVQWLRVPDGQPTPALEALCRRLAGGDTSPPPPRASIHPGGASPWMSPPSPPGQPSQPSQPSENDTQGPFKATPFPTHEPGQGLRYGVEIIGWSLRNAYGLWRQLPRWIRWGIIVWAVLGLMSQCNSDRHEKRTTSSPPLPPATQGKLDQKLEQIARQYGKDPSSVNLSKLGALVGKEMADDTRSEGATVLALPFTAPAGDTSAAHLVADAFAQTYTRIALLRHSQLSTDEHGVPGCELRALLERGRKKDLQYVLCGAAVAAASAPAVLTITLIDVEAGQSIWQGVYPVASADAAAIAQDVATHVPAAGRD